MCFTPAISLATAIIEFFLATFILLRFKRTISTKFAAILIYILGIYQFTEYGLCSFQDPQIWARAGFIAYTLLPAIGLYFTLHFTKVKKKWIALLPIPIFSIPAILVKDFIVETSCSTYFVVIRTLLDAYEYNFWTIYYLYYSLFIVAATFILWKCATSEKNKLKRKIYFLWVFGILLMTLPALLLVVVLPSLGIMFPSIYCEFALIFALLVFIAAFLENKLNADARTFTNKFRLRTK